VNVKVNSQQTIHRFTRITDIWINIAYAHKLPVDEVFNEIHENWNFIFSANALDD